MVRYIAAFGLPKILGLDSQLVGYLSSGEDLGFFKTPETVPYTGSIPISEDAYSLFVNRFGEDRYLWQKLQEINSENKASCALVVRAEVVEEREGVDTFIERFRERYENTFEGNLRVAVYKTSFHKD